MIRQYLQYTSLFAFFVAISHFLRAEFCLKKAYQRRLQKLPQDFKNNFTAVRGLSELELEPQGVETSFRLRVGLSSRIPSYISHINGRDQASDLNRYSFPKNHENYSFPVKSRVNRFLQAVVGAIATTFESRSRS
jgi:hypothetical protein